MSHHSFCCSEPAGPPRPAPPLLPSAATSQPHSSHSAVVPGLIQGSPGRPPTPWRAHCCAALGHLAVLRHWAPWVALGCFPARGEGGTWLCPSAPSHPGTSETRRAGEGLLTTPDRWGAQWTRPVNSLSHTQKLVSDAGASMACLLLQ